MVFRCTCNHLLRKVHKLARDHLKMAFPAAVIGLVCSAPAAILNFLLPSASVSVFFNRAASEQSPVSQTEASRAVCLFNAGPSPNCTRGNSTPQTTAQMTNSTKASAHLPPRKLLKCNVLAMGDDISVELVVGFPRCCSLLFIQQAGVELSHAA